MREINLMLHEVDQNELLPRQKATAGRLLQKAA